MKIKSGVWYRLAVASGTVGLLYGMGMEGSFQTGSTISDGQFATALCLVLAAVLFLRLGFAAQDREQNARRYGRVDRTHARTEEPEGRMSMIVYAYAYRKNPRGCDVRQFTDPLTPDEYPGEPASVKAQHWADENIRHYEMIQVRDALGNLLYAR